MSGWYWPQAQHVAKWWFSALGRDRDAVNDAAVDALIGAVVSPGRNPDIDPWPFISRRLTWRMLQAIRTHKRRRKSIPTYAEYDCEGLKDRHEESLDPDRLAGLLARLKPLPRAVIRGHYLDGLSYQAVGIRCGITADAARQLAARTIQKIRKRV